MTTRSHVIITLLLMLGLSANVYAQKASFPPASGGSAFPVTITGGVSGGIPCFTSTTNMAASTALTAGTDVIGGGAGTCPSSGSLSDNGSGGFTGPSAADLIFNAGGTKNIDLVSSGGSIFLAGSQVAATQTGSPTTRLWTIITDTLGTFSLYAGLNGGVSTHAFDVSGSTGYISWANSGPATAVPVCDNTAVSLAHTLATCNGLTQSGTITFSGVTTGTNADFACFAAGGVMTLQTTACTVSSRRFKQNIHPLSMSALSEVMKLKPVVFNRIPDQKNPDVDVNAYVKQIGLIAENVASVDPKAAVYEQDGVTPKSYRQESIIALLVKAVQEQQKEITELKSQLAH